MGKKKLGADLPSEVVDGFSEWVEGEGFSKARAATRALELFQKLPDAFLKLIMRGEWTVVVRLLAPIDEQVRSMKGATTEDAKQDDQAAAEGGPKGKRHNR